MFDAGFQFANGIGSIQVAAVTSQDVGVNLLNAGEIDDLAQAALLVLKNEHGASAAINLHAFEPVLKARIGDVLVALHGVVDQQVERAASQEKMMRRVVNLLPAKVPIVEVEPSSVWHCPIVPPNVDAFRGFIGFGERKFGAVEPSEEAGLAGSAVPKDEHLGFVKLIDLACRLFSEVVEDGLSAPLDDIR